MSALTEVAARNLTTLVSLHVPEGPSRDAAMACIGVLSTASPLYHQLLHTLAASDQNNAMAIIAEHHVRENRVADLPGIVLEASTGETLRDRVLIEAEEWGVTEDISTGLTDSVLTIVAGALKVG